MIKFSNKKKDARIKSILLKYIAPENILYLLHLRDMFTKNNYSFKRVIIPGVIKPKERVLILSPHPDDEVIGMGGTLNLHLSKGNEIMIVYMADGGKANPNIDEEKMVNIRKLEYESLNKEYNFKYTFLGFKDLDLYANEESVSAVKNIIESFCPTMIYLPSYLDSHKDHFATNHILYEALKVCNKKNIKIFGYEVWTNIPFPNYSIDISDYFDEKLKMISFYKSQTAIIDFENLCKSRNSLNYLMYINYVKKGYAEVFLYFIDKDYIEIFEKLVKFIYEKNNY